MERRIFYQERIAQLPKVFADTIISVMDVVKDITEIEKVIMFGSCARGAQTEKSDVDLLLLLKDENGLPFNQLEKQIGIKMYERLDTAYKRPVDLLFADGDVYGNSTWIGSVYFCAKREGVVLYE